MPKLHVMDDHEVAHDAHVIQNKLLGRPTYRKYKGQKMLIKRGPGGGNHPCEGRPAEINSPNRATYFAPTHQRKCCVRMSNEPSHTAGVARQ